MFYKLSCSSTLQSLEEEFGIKHCYSKIFESYPLINGIKEQIVSIITCEEEFAIQYATWGLLPEEYSGNWYTFQNVKNTLNLDISQDVRKIKNYKKCVVLISGFFVNYLYKGEIYPFLIEFPDQKPFGLAGIYSQLSDGFLTCAILLDTTLHPIKKLTNLDQLLPIMLEKQEIHSWLECTQDSAFFSRLRENNQKLKLSSRVFCKLSYEKDLFNQNVPKDGIYKTLASLY